MTLITDPDKIKETPHKYLDIMGMVWISLLLVTMFTTLKTFTLGPFIFPVGVIFYPLTYIFADMFTEVYGYRKTRRIVWTGFACILLTSAVAYLYCIIPPDESFMEDKAFQTIFKASPIIAIATIMGFFCGEFANSYTMAKMKIWTKGKHLWARLVSSTAVGQILDNGVAGLIACFIGGYFTPEILPKMIFSIVLFCTLWEFIATPITYKITAFLKKAEGLDIYDTNTDFNPFHVGRLDKAG